MPSRKCPSCATLLGAADAKCPSCGADLVETERSSLDATASHDPQRHDNTQLEVTSPRSSQESSEERETIPTQIGRYEIQRVLGGGGFGIVYLAHDPVVNRPVALKVPRRSRFQASGDVDRFIEEARSAGNLTHPSLVAVYDVQQHDHLPYIVQQYIEGQNLGDWAAEHQPSFEQIARILVRVAEAVGYAHQQRLIHCDLKLANVLIDTAGEPHVADFGLAIHESVQPHRKGERFGTPAMMAPEQVRGESHRLDDRTDIWAMGIMLYELLVGRRPFSAADRDELFEEIKHHDPKPPRQIDRSVPKELERICLKCLSKRRSDRYNMADDLIDDLKSWMSMAEPSTHPFHATTTTARSKPDSSSPSKPPAKIIPKGLRSFDASDADFFLELLPGPCDRHGLPESIRFWKSRIEQTDPDETFSVGLIYGPSGCGKSSLVKAGLLPRLRDDVLPIYIEATGDDTEARILKQIRKHFPNITSSPLSHSQGRGAGGEGSSAPPDNQLSLPDACAILRLTGAGRGRKVLLIIDQFEQWLHTHADVTSTQLVDALRQCEGGKLQAVLMVRDDFYLSANCVFQELDIRLLEGQNFYAVNRFDKRHARKVLKAFGLSYGALDEIGLTPEQKKFTDHAIDELAEDNRVISVRLAVFADMMQSRPWVPQSLQDVGGVAGVGVTFLEETFSSKSAPPSHRVHEQAIRGVLKALLPDAGTDIKGAMQSTDELRKAAEYEDNHKQFDELIQILDSELRLITPSDPEGTDARSDTPHYQLTHDYLVPSLREWLTRKQRETRRGRAELRLAERSALWNSRPEIRHLPSWWEYLNIRLLTSKQDWTPPQRKMLSRARRVHSTRWGIAIAIMLIVGVSIQQYVASVRHRNLTERLEEAVNSMGTAAWYKVPDAVENLRQDDFTPDLVLDRLRVQFDKGPTSQKLNFAYALAAFDEVELEYLLSRIADAAGNEYGNIVTALAQDKDRALPGLEDPADNADEQQDWRLKGRLAVVALHLGDSSIATDINKPDQPDPTQQTVFIHDVFPTWHGDLGRLANQIQREDDPGLRHGICLAVGKLTDLGDAKQQWHELFARWYQQSPGSGTHGAAGWALRQWQADVPTLPVDKTDPVRRDWMVTDHGLKLIRVPAGSFARTHEKAHPSVTQSVTLSDFWLSDQEVSVGLFQQFIRDEDYEGPKSKRWEGVVDRISPTGQHPVQQVSWEDAVLFCNWLTAQEVNLTPYYSVKDLAKPTLRQTLEVEILTNGTGYRLPTEAEWEYACRASSTTDFCFGNNEQRLRDYAVYSATKTDVPGAQMCNRLGFFDMHGNVFEWCYDRYRYSHDDQPATDPTGPPAGPTRVYRGGSWSHFATYCRSGYRAAFNPTDRYDALGFRVALSPSGQASE